MTLRILQQRIDEFRKEHGDLPEDLTDIPELHGLWNNPDGPPVDEWEHPIQYRSDGTSFDLYSHGRDGQPGGIGLDADIFHDGRNREHTLATFAQYFGETDQSEVDRGGFFMAMAGLIAGCMIAFITFGSLNDLDTSERALKPAYFTAYAVAIVCIASLVGAFLLPLHIPSGH